MSSDTPNKEALPKELLRVLNTLTEDAQRAATRKSTELNFDPNKGRISLEETLINLTQARDILLDAIEKGKFVQLPLKLQYEFYSQVLGVDRELRELADGRDAVLNLEAAVEELNASVWQFRLHDLSDQVLGFHSKMNQLKSQEAAIRKKSGSRRRRVRPVAPGSRSDTRTDVRPGKVDSGRTHLDSEADGAIAVNAS